VVCLGLVGFSSASVAATTSTDLGGLFTVSSLLSLQGAAAACLIVPNVLGVLIGPRFGPRLRNWTAFVLAEALAYVTAAIVDDGNWLRWIIACLNGFLIFASAFGLDSAGSRVTRVSDSRSDAVMRGPSSAERRFFMPWSF
jgi:hypothetical protein